MAHSRFDLSELLDALRAGGGIDVIRAASRWCSEVLGLDIGATETGAFWTALLRSQRARGLAGVQLVISDRCASLTRDRHAVTHRAPRACRRRSVVAFCAATLTRPSGRRGRRVVSP